MHEMTDSEHEAITGSAIRRDLDRERYSVKGAPVPSQQAYTLPPVTEIINLCPFDIIIVDQDDKPVFRWGAAKRPAKILGGRRKVGYHLNGTQAPVGVFEYGRTIGLPSQRPGVAYIVTNMVLDKHPERTDLLITDSGKDSIRNNQDRVVAVRRLLALNVPPYERS